MIDFFRLKVDGKWRLRVIAPVRWDEAVKRQRTADTKSKPEESSRDTNNEIIKLIKSGTSRRFRLRPHHLFIVM
jgi:hypothetical protein